MSDDLQLGDTAPTQSPQEAAEGPQGSVLGMLAGLATAATIEQTSTPEPLANATRYQLTKEINAAQLSDELTTALNQSVVLSLTDWDQTRAISADNVATLWIQPAGLPSEIVTTVIDNHAPNYAYDVPLANQRYNEIAEKVLANQSVVLTPDEVAILVKGLFLKVGVDSSVTHAPSFADGAPRA